jgi:hypothetical protein
MRVAIVLAVAGGIALQAAAPEVFDVGVLRRDGIVVPFATFDGRRWTSHWPAPQVEATVPINLESVPSKWWGAGAHAEWTAVLRADGERRVRVTQPDVFDAHCYRQVGLRTDYVPDAVPPPPAEQPYPKDGLVVAPPRPVEKIDVLPVDGADARALAPVLLQAFNKADRDLVDRLNDVTRLRDVGADDEAPTIEALYGHGTDPRVYYVEASRRHPVLGGASCGATIVFATGWFVRQGTTFRAITMTADAVDGCERAGASYMLPFGVIRSGTRLFWIVQFSGWDHERFVIVEPKANSVDAVLNEWEGGC